jgi:hypothetical protein
MSRVSYRGQRAMELLNQAAEKSISPEDFIARATELQDPLAGPVDFRVTPKGLIAAYGVSKIPVCLPPTMWAKLLEAKDRLLGFARDHAEDLAKAAEVEAPRKALADARHKRTVDRIAEQRREET